MNKWNNWKFCHTLGPVIVEIWNASLACGNYGGPRVGYQEGRSEVWFFTTTGWHRIGGFWENLLHGKSLFDRSETHCWKEDKSQIAKKGSKIICSIFSRLWWCVWWWVGVGSARKQTATGQLGLVVTWRDRRWSQKLHKRMFIHHRPTNTPTSLLKKIKTHTTSTRKHHPPPEALKEPHRTVPFSAHKIWKVSQSNSVTTVSLDEIVTFQKPTFINPLPEHVSNDRAGPTRCVTQCNWLHQRRGKTGCAHDGQHPSPTELPCEGHVSCHVWVDFQSFGDRDVSQELNTPRSQPSRWPRLRRGQLREGPNFVLSRCPQHRTTCACPAWCQ